MKPKTPQKRVLAQRKFAQGVSVPLLERRNESPSTSIQSQSSVEKVEKQVSFSFSANKYLDWVAFQKIHAHESDSECMSLIDGELSNDSIIDCMEEKKIYDLDRKIKEISQKAPVIMIKKLDLSLLSDKSNDSSERNGTSKKVTLKRKKSNRIHIVRSSDNQSPSSEVEAICKNMPTKRQSNRSKELSDDSSEDDPPLNKLCVKNKQKIIDSEETSCSTVTDQVERVFRAIDLNDNGPESEDPEDTTDKDTGLSEETQTIADSVSTIGISVIRENPSVGLGSSDDESDLTRSCELSEAEYGDVEDDDEESMSSKYKGKTSDDSPTCSLLNTGDSGEQENSQKDPIIMIKKIDLSELSEKSTTSQEKDNIRKVTLKRKKSTAYNKLQAVRSLDSQSPSSEIDAPSKNMTIKRQPSRIMDNSSCDNSSEDDTPLNKLCAKNKQKVVDSEETTNDVEAAEQIQEDVRPVFIAASLDDNDDEKDEHNEEANVKGTTEITETKGIGVSVIKNTRALESSEEDFDQLSEDDHRQKVQSSKYKHKNGEYICAGNCPAFHKTGEEESLLIPLNSWNKQCKNCHVLTKIRNTVSTMVEKDSNPEDVYQFRCENNKPTHYRHNTPQPQTNTMYLDCFEDDSPYIIQIISCKQDSKPSLSARILRRSDLDPQLLKKASGDITNPAFIKEILSSLEEPVSPNTSTPNNNGPTEVESDQNKRKPKRTHIFPRPSQEAVMVEAPVYRPTNAEFENPIVYIESIRPEAEKFGICKIIPPPDFKPPFNNIPEDLNFMSSNQYICKMYMRWASASRELCAIKTYLATQNVVFKRPPLIDGIEVNLAKLYHKVQRMGGLREVIEKKKWARVAEEMNYSKTSNVETKLDRFYCKYLLPYDTLTSMERQDILRKVEVEWNKRFNKMLFRARNPLYRQQRILMETSSDEDDDEDFPSLDESEDCVLPGRQMNVRTFKNIAQRSMEIHFPTHPNPTPTQVENVYWEHVLFGRDHICVNTASIDTGERSFGFTKNKSDPYSKHPWNLKVLSNNPLSVLRSMGPVLSATVPALHLGMVFTTSCWHRDPHGLPWIEYLHEGPPKIWYGIPHDWSENFRKAVETLAPAYCQNKAIWLPSDIAMFPPKLLIDNKVSLSKTTQQAGEYIVVFPKAYSSSICTGFSISESVYFAPHSWLMTMQIDFQEVRDSCEPTMFSLEHLLLSIANDQRSSQAVKIQIHNSLDIIIRDEIENRYALEKLGVPINVYMQPPKKKSFLHSWNVGEHTECDICRRILFLSKVTGISGLDLCLEHAVRMLEVKSNEQIAEIKKCINVICFYTEDSLDEIMKSLRNSIM